MYIFIAPHWATRHKYASIHYFHIYYSQYWHINIMVIYEHNILDKNSLSSGLLIKIAIFSLQSSHRMQSNKHYTCFYMNVEGA